MIICFSLFVLSFLFPLTLLPSISLCFARQVPSFFCLRRDDRHAHDARGLAAALCGGSGCCCCGFLSPQIVVCCFGGSIDFVDVSDDNVVAFAAPSRSEKKQFPDSEHANAKGYQRSPNSTKRKNKSSAKEAGGRSDSERFCFVWLGSFVQNSTFLSLQPLPNNNSPRPPPEQELVPRSGIRRQRNLRSSVCSSSSSHICSRRGRIRRRERTRPSLPSRRRRAPGASGEQNETPRPLRRLRRAGPPRKEPLRRRGRVVLLPELWDDRCGFLKVFLSSLLSTCKKKISKKLKNLEEKKTS